MPLIVGWAGGGVGGTRLFGVGAWLWQLGGAGPGRVVSAILEWKHTVLS